MRLEAVACDILKTCLMRLNHRLDDNRRRHITDAHEKELHQRDLYSRHFGRQPKHERNIVEEYCQQDKRSHDSSTNKINIVRIHS